MNKHKDNVVIILAKKPKLGKVKTRIAEETSDNFAYEFAKACFADLVHNIANSNYYDLIVGVDSSDELLWFQKNFSLEGIVINYKNETNKQKTLSNKFENVFFTLSNKNSYKKILLIPMDIPFLSEEDVITALTRLDQKRFVFGPEINGGIYLISIKSPYKKNLFKKVRWSTSNSFKDLVKNCKKENVFSLKLKNDLNMPADILNLRDEIYYSCPTLYDFLRKNGYYLPTENRYINFDNLSISIPVVSNLVQKKGKKETEILMQTRYKPTIDPENTGKLEIPSGLIKRYELAQDAAIRETKEETGIISKISNNQKIITYTTKKNGNIVVVYKPFCCSQQLKGERAYIAISFVSDYIGGKLTEKFRENRNPRWIPVSKIKKILVKKPEKIFTLSLATLKEYFKYEN
ncbi:MAG: DUF2064 domain-containing protein [Promethearchaeota archaeon]